MSASAAALRRRARLAAFLAVTACGAASATAGGTLVTPSASMRPLGAGSNAAWIAVAGIHPLHPVSSTPWVFSRTRFNAAWSQTVGDPSVTIAIVDTGVDPSASELAGALLPGYNFYDGNSDTRDVLGHGTGVASVAAARADGRAGIVGACSRCSVLPVRVARPDGLAAVSTIAAGIIWAAEQGARIINVSLTTPEYSQALADAVAYAQRRGSLVVAAAGNEGLNRPDYPAALPGVISVEAATEGDAPYVFSNHGPAIALAAPGCLLVATLGGGHASACGTSLSAPLVAGAAGLLAAARPAASASEIVWALEAGADRVGDTRYGRLDVARSLTLLTNGRGPTQTPNAETVQGVVSDR